MFYTFYPRFLFSHLFIQSVYFSLSEIPKPSVAPKGASELNRPNKDGKSIIYYHRVLNDYRDNIIITVYSIIIS